MADQGSLTTICFIGVPDFHTVTSTPHPRLGPPMPSLMIEELPSLTEGPTRACWAWRMPDAQLPRGSSLTLRGSE